jgi:hypothetical protein
MLAPEPAEMLRQALLAREHGMAVPIFMYLDPGTGSLVFQWIVAGLVAGAFTIRMSWRRIVAKFQRGGDGARKDD